MSCFLHSSNVFSKKAHNFFKFMQLASSTSLSMTFRPDLSSLTEPSANWLKEWAPMQGLSQSGNRKLLLPLTDSEALQLIMSVHLW